MVFRDYLIPIAFLSHKDNPHSCEIYVYNLGLFREHQSEGFGKMSPGMFSFIIHGLA